MGLKKAYLIFLIAFLTKILLSLVLNTYNHPEVFEYETITNNILQGNGFLYNFWKVPYKAFVQPFYPVFTVIVYSLTNHSQAAMVLIQCLISSLLSFIIYSIALRFTGSKEAFLAAVLTAFHPGLTVYSIFKLHSLVFDTFFYLLSIALILKFIRLPNVKNALLTGSVIGFALLSRFTILPFIIFGFFYLFFVLKGIDIKTRIKYIFVIYLAAIIIYSPWVIRNYKVFHKFVFMQTCSGENLWQGNNSSASGSTILFSCDSMFIKMPEPMRQELNTLDELGQVKCYNKYFLNFIKEQPYLFIKLFFKKLYYFWWFSPHIGILYKTSWLHIYKLYYMFIVLFALCGAAISLKNKVNYATLAIIFVYMLSISFIHAVVNVDTRHRWTIEPIIIVFASIGFFHVIFYLINRFRNFTHNCCKEKIS